MEKVDGTVWKCARCVRQNVDAVRHSTILFCLFFYMHSFYKYIAEIQFSKSVVPILCIEGFIMSSIDVILDRSCANLPG